MMTTCRRSQITAKGVIVGVLFSIAFLAIAISPSQAWANWNFDPSCSAIEVTEVEDPRPPNAFLMLDQSGSMGFLYDSSGQNTLWTVAVQAIDQAVNALDDDIRFGLGLFPADGACQTFCIWIWCWTTCGRDGAREEVVSDYNNHSSIMSVLNASYASGGTPTWAALYQIRVSDSMNEAGRSAGGVLITDGQPCCHSSARQDTIDAACDLRDEGYLTYAVGLGGATDQDFNNKMAAALGTGCCGSGANENCTNGLGVDPCTNSSVQDSTCYGSYQAYNQTEFRNALLAIGDEIGCTFPIDTSLHSDGEAPDDTGAVRVEMLTASGWVNLEHRDVSDDGEGWYYPSSQSRDQVTLTSEYCSMVQAGHVDRVETQLACECQEAEGTACSVNNPPPGTCPEGVWSCSSGYDLCEPLPASLCPVDCPGYDHVIGDFCTPGASPSEILSAAGEDYDFPLSRCDVGEVVCYEGAMEPVCEAKFRPMPEICDGMDNSCDGKVDNIEESWSEWYASSTWEDWMEGRDADDSDSQHWGSWSAGMDLPPGNSGATCGIQDICACREGPTDAHYGSGSTVAEEFADYLNSRDSSCMCVAPLGR